MKLRHPIPVQTLAARLAARLIGSAEQSATGINELHWAEAGDIIFVDYEKYYRPALDSPATIILIDKETDCPAGKTLLVVDDPFTAYNSIVLAERPLRLADVAGVHPSVTIGEGSYVEAGALVGADATIGRDCLICAGAVIREGCRIGNEVIIRSGAVIGSEAFYFKKTPQGRVAWRSGGTVVLEDRVEIGPNCTIARGISSETRIGAGTKLDALVQIGHDVKIGRDCLIVSQVGIAGNTVLGDRVSVMGQAGIAQNLHIGDDATILAKAGLGKNVPAGQSFFGIPAEEARKAMRNLFYLRRLNPDNEKPE